MELHVGGPKTLRKYIKLSTDYKEDLEQYEYKNQNEKDKPNINEEKYIRKASSKLYAYMYLDNADKSKYELISKKFKPTILTRQQSISIINNQSK